MNLKSLAVSSVSRESKSWKSQISSQSQTITQHQLLLLIAGCIFQTPFRRKNSMRIRDH